MLGLRTALYPVHDLTQARDWFAQLFDRPAYFDQPFYVGFDVGGFELGLLPVEGAHVPSTDGAEPLWGVADLDATFAHALALGATAIAEPHEVGGGIRVATLRDPFGNRLGLIFNPHFKVPALGTVTVDDPPHRVLAAAEGALADVDIVVERTLPAPRAAVWAAWTTAQALGTWFGSDARMALCVGGPFEILFAGTQQLPSGRAGRDDFYGPERTERGSEGCKVLSFVPGRLLSFSWNAPPHLTHTRAQLTWVVVELADLAGETTLRLTHTGWPAAGFGPDGHPEWPQTRDYFAQAWPRVVDALAEYLAGAAQTAR